MNSIRWSLCLSAILLLSGCSDDAPQQPNDISDVRQDEGDGVEDIVELEGTKLRFEPESSDFFAVPLPSDVRLNAEGSADLHKWARAYENALVKLWFDAADELMNGWGLISGIFMNFSAPIDPASLPQTVEETVIAPGAELPSVFLMNVDSASPQKGRTLPIECKFTETAGTYHDANLLSCISPFGVVRQANTRYALVLTTGLKDEDGESLVPALAMQRLLAGQDVEGQNGTVAAAPYVETKDILVEAGLSADAIASVVIFTTGNPSSRLVQVNDWYRELPEPEIEPESLEFVEAFDDYIVLRGTYQVPVIQGGERPFSAPPAGKIVFDDAGKPVVQAQDSVPFLLTIPKSTMPAEGWPTLMYMHGSGGQMQELVDRGARTDRTDPTSAPRGSGPGGVVAPYGIAGFAAEFGFHGTRFSPPDTSGLTLYNLLGNPRAAVDNFIVASNEVTLHARLLAGLTIDPQDFPELAGVLDVSQAGDGLIRFDDERLSAMGQSMGSTIGVPALTVSKKIDAGILSGSGATLIEVALKTTKPVTLLPVLRGLLRYRADEAMDRFDPVLSTLQYAWDFVDPSVHARHLIRELHPGAPAKHILQHSGVDDGYFSIYSRTALSGAIGLDFVEPNPEPETLEIMKIIAPEHSVALSTPVAANLQDATITGVVAVYEPEVMDGHNIAYQVDAVKAQYACFAKSVGVGAAPVFRSVADSQVDTCE